MSRAADPLSGRDLAAFAAAVEAGTIGGAADALALTQSALTKRVQSLERRLGTALLVRSRTGVRATAAGAALYPEAKLALDALAAAEAAVIAAAATGVPLRLAASHTIGEVLLPGWLADFRRARAVGAAARGGSPPAVRAQVEIINSPAVLRAVRDGAADVGFVEGDDAAGDLDELVVAHDELACVVAADHGWGRRRSVRAAELAREPYLAREAGSGTRAVAEHALAAAGVRLQPALEVASLESLRRAVRDGGFTVVSRLAVAGAVADGTLVALPVRGAELRRDLRAVRRRGGPPGGPARAFWSFLARDVAPGAGTGD